MKKINWQYTLGEILIVIIGITIAFSMNKCADETNNKTQKEQYINSLINDIEADKVTLSGNLISIKEKFNKVNEIMPLLGNDDQNKMAITKNVFEIARLVNFRPNNITYQALINSGDFKLIHDFKTKTAIEKHYSNYDLTLKDYERMENINKEYLGSYFIHNSNYDNMKLDKSPFQDEQLLKNIIQSISGALRLKTDATQRAIDSCDELLKILKLDIS